MSEISIETFRRDGFITVGELFSQNDIDEIRTTFMDQMNAGPIEGLSEIRKEYAADDPLARYPRMLHPHLHKDKPVGSIAMHYMLHPSLRPILRQLFEDQEPLAVQSMFY